MQRFIIIIALFLTMLLTTNGLAAASLQADAFLIARVISVEPGRTETVLGAELSYSILNLELLSGQEKGRSITLEVDRFSDDDTTAPRAGDRVTVRQTIDRAGELSYSVEDHYRLPALGWIAALFIGLIGFFARAKGIGALLGLGVSILALKFFIVPALTSGANPILVTLLGSFGIATVSMLLAHGVRRQTWLALASTLLTLLLGTGLASLFVRFAKLSGLGSEGAFYLTASGNTFDFSGLLLGAIIIGMLGVLDDVTTAQTAAVAELAHANPLLSSRELYRRGLNIGREHIASLVNTLVLAYAGVGLPLFLLFSLNASQPLWIILNGEPMAEEIVRTLAGSSALILAVPISTWIAARWLHKKTS